MKCWNTPQLECEKRLYCRVFCSYCSCVLGEWTPKIRDPKSFVGLPSCSKSSKQPSRDRKRKPKQRCRRCMIICFPFEFDPSIREQSNITSALLTFWPPGPLLREYERSTSEKKKKKTRWRQIKCVGQAIWLVPSIFSIELKRLGHSQVCKPSSKPAESCAMISSQFRNTCMIAPTFTSPTPYLSHSLLYTIYKYMSTILDTYQHVLSSVTVVSSASLVNFVYHPWKRRRKNMEKQCLKAPIKYWEMDHGYVMDVFQSHPKFSSPITGPMASAPRHILHGNATAGWGQILRLLRQLCSFFA